MTRSVEPRCRWSAAMSSLDCLSIRDDALHVEGANTLDLAERHGTPLLVLVSQPDAPATQMADIVGHSCYADQIVLGAKVPDVRSGEVVALLETGAYQESSASNFNSLPRPASVLVHGDRAELIKRSETVDDVYGRDVIPERLLGKSADAV